MFSILGLVLIVSTCFGVPALRRAVNRPNPPVLLRHDMTVELILLGYMTLFIIGLCIILKDLF